MLEVRRLTKVYDSAGIQRKVLNDVSINFRTSEFVAVLGPSGSGKTTFLNIIGGLDRYTSGDLIINERSTKKYRDKDWDSYRNHRIGFVFQSYNLIPHQTVLQNVRLALTLSGVSKRESVKRARKALSDVGLEDHIMKRPSQLSGGQMQRVAIARALVNNPDILLADEPTGALDSETSLQIMNLLKQVAEKRLVIMVTHNPELAETYATRIVTLKDGRITSDSNRYNGRKNTALDTDGAKKRQKKTKMSFWTAFGLSLRNLLTKKTRTLLVAFAGSIGIIGIALILAVSTGFHAYIDSIERDTLTSYPLVLSRESANMSGMLLGMFGNAADAADSVGDGTASDTVEEKPVITSMIDKVAINDLQNFQKYLDNHYPEVSDDIRMTMRKYNVTPLVYTTDRETGALIQTNPNSVIYSLLGDSVLTSNALMSASSFDMDTFIQYDIGSIKEYTTLVTGRYPENYDEVVLFLSNPEEIADYLTYVIGFHDPAKLSEVIKKTLAGEKVELDEESLTIGYDDLLGTDLRLLNAADTYRYNATYNIYEDMSEDTQYMKKLYDAAERLKIVGIVTGDGGSGSGFLYLPSLTEHIIERAADTEIVKRQLDNPTLNVFTGKAFGEEASPALDFADLVSVDTSKIRRAFSFNLNESKLRREASEYIQGALGDLTRQIIDELKTIEPLINQKAEEVQKTLINRVKDLITSGEIDLGNLNEEEIAALIEKIIKEAVGETDFTELEKAIKDFHIEDKISAKIDGFVKYLSSTVEGAFSVDEAMLMSAFSLNFTEAELTRLIATMFAESDATLSSNLSKLGYQALSDPSSISFYFNTFDGKTHFVEFLNQYNDMMRSYNQDDKVIEYTDPTGILTENVKTIVDAISYILIAFVSISLVVSSIMIGVITYISVYERTKEIGILRAIGASKRNISSIFNAETFIVGLLSGILGIGISFLFIPLINLVIHHFAGDIAFNAQLAPFSAGILIGLSIVLTLIGGLIPAQSASRKDPVEALRSE